MLLFFCLGLGERISLRVTLMAKATNFNAENLERLQRGIVKMIKLKAGK